MATMDDLTRARRCMETLAGIPDAALDKVRELVEACRKLGATNAKETLGGWADALEEADNKMNTAAYQLAALLAKVQP